MSNIINSASFPLDIAGQVSVSDSVESANSSNQSYFGKAVENMFSTIDDSHNFLQQMINYNGIIDAKKMQQVHAAAEEFTLSTELASKTISLTIRGIDTLIKIQ